MLRSRTTRGWLLPYESQANRQRNTRSLDATYIIAKAHEAHAKDPSHSLAHHLFNAFADLTEGRRKGAKDALWKLVNSHD